MRIIFCAVLLWVEVVLGARALLVGGYLMPAQLLRLLRLVSWPLEFVLFSEECGGSRIDGTLTYSMKQWHFPTLPPPPLMRMQIINISNVSKISQEVNSIKRMHISKCKNDFNHSKSLGLSRSINQYLD